MDSTLLNFGSFCSGVGWLDEGFRLACEYHGIRARSVFAGEWDFFATSVLRSRMEDAALEPCPIWCGDLREFPSERFRGVVDAAVFGFPCTDISCAGKRAGLEGTRSGLFFDILAKVREMGCWLVAMENVAAITTLGLDSVLGEMADSGFDAEWCCLTAAEVGASHKRNRWFCVGVNRDVADTELQRYTSQSRSIRSSESEKGAGEYQPSVSVDDSGRDLADTAQRGLGECGQPSAGGIRCEEQHGSGRVQDAREGCIELFAPGPSDPRWPDILRDYQHLAPAIEPGFHQLVDGRAMVVDEARADQLRCCGNGVVVLQAAASFATLLARIWR